MAFSPTRNGIPAASAKRPSIQPTAVDTIIQSSTVELMRSHSVSVAPRPRTDMASLALDSEVAGVVRFYGPDIVGSLTLGLPVAVYELMMQRLQRSSTHSEWVYELTNQVMGQIKNRLIQFQVKLRTHLPLVLSGAALERHRQRRAEEVLYSFGTLRGDITVAVDASLTRALLEYSNAPLLVRDSDLLLFDDLGDEPSM